MNKSDLKKIIREVIDEQYSENTSSANFGAMQIVRALKANPIYKNVGFTLMSASKAANVTANIVDTTAKQESNINFWVADLDNIGVTVQGSDYYGSEKKSLEFDNIKDVLNFSKTPLSVFA